MRSLNLLLVTSLIALAYFIYDVKYETRELDARVAELRKKVRDERDAVAILRAEWSHLNRPERLQRLARKHVGLRPVAGSQVVSREQLPALMLKLAPGPLAGRSGTATGQPVSAVR
ncbi:MAG: hypothetical protein D6773_15310 [Alphaproteobacteria bacterium]|nr:MAG: hypothetical protein D6773_15310 [Alphaproteobacteria bacterium]